MIVSEKALQMMTNSEKTHKEKMKTINADIIKP